jgi:hypothetical protein
MQPLELRIHGPLRADEVRALLSRPDSGIILNPPGFASGLREQRRSVVGAIGDVVTYAGLLVNTAQLAVTIYQIYQAQKSAGTGPGTGQRPQVEMATARGTLSVPNATSGEIEHAIAQHVADAK